MSQPYQFTEQGSILDAASGKIIPLDIQNRDYAEYLKWVAAGNSADPTPVLPLTEAQIEAQAGAAVTQMLDALAQSWQYSSYQSARTYKGDVNAKFNAEGTAIADYGSTCFAYLDGIKSGKNPRPADTAALLAALPAAPARPA